jgi:lysophospholipase L1-like esterase
MLIAARDRQVLRKDRAMTRLALICTVIVTLCVGLSAPVTVAADGTAAIRYLALGDSYAYGLGASDPATRGYVSLFTASLTAAARTTVTAFNLADPGATSGDLVGDYATRGSAGTSQLARAVQLLSTGGVNLVTLDSGGNDILQLLDRGQPCAGTALVSDSCLAAVQKALGGETAVNMPRILTALLTAAKPETRIIVLTYPNPYSVGTNSIVEQRTNAAVQALNTIIAGAVTAAQPVATTRGVTLTTVDLFPLFAGRSGILTHYLDAESDVHPTDAGYAVIAEAVIAAYRHATGADQTSEPAQPYFNTRLSG